MNHALRNELLAMEARDRDVRADLARDGSLFGAYHPRMAQVHDAHAGRLREIIHEVGWPTEPLVGADGAKAAWLVAQHAINHPGFMRECRTLLDQASARGEVPRWQFEYIDDRIRVFEGQPQRFGTQQLAPAPEEPPMSDSERQRFEAERDRWRRRIGWLVMAVVLALPNTARAQERDWMFGPFVKPRGVNPVLVPSGTSSFISPTNDSTVQWEGYATFNPAAVMRNGQVHLLYRAEDATGEEKIGHHTSRIGLASSGDGLRFTRRPRPVLYPDRDDQRQYEWPGGVEDPRVVETEDGRYVMTYTQWNRDIPRLAVATSPNLLDWTKHGPAFEKHPAHMRVESKSGAILSRLVGNRIVATKVSGKYWMYYGVPDIRIATSDDLLDWSPLDDANGVALKVLSPRPGYFDSWLVEAGPPAIMTRHGIVVMYNAGNSRQHGDSTLPDRVYTAGQALFDARNPVKLLARTDRPFLRPTEEYERTGQYKEGTTFVEGLVRFNGRWYLYYGTADSRVGVAIWDPAGRR